MTTAATCAFGQVSRSSSYYRGEQYDTDLGLYYLRARYYNPITGRFLSRDPEDGNAKNPASLHKYLYAGGDPVNAKDPGGRADLVDVVLVTAFIAQQACRLVGMAVIYYEMEMLEKVGHLVDPGIPWKPGLICVVIGL
jgi:RHS repeat-associated protein